MPGSGFSVGRDRQDPASCQPPSCMRGAQPGLPAGITANPRSLVYSHNRVSNSKAFRHLPYGHPSLGCFGTTLSIA